MPAHVHEAIVYYEDTDFTGAVYHANYLRYMERAREHLLGIDDLVRRWRDERFGFVVYRADVTFREPAVHGDHLEVHTTVERASRVRLRCTQRILRTGRPICTGLIDLVPVRDGKIAEIPPELEALLDRYAEASP